MKVLMCRSCGSARLQVVLDLGDHPVSNALLTRDPLRQEEKRYPLAVLFCTDCALLQVGETIPPDALYQRDYPYYSSSSPALLEHAAAIAERLIHERRLGPQSWVIEVASNDGYLLRNFLSHGVPCLGIDPAVGPSERANAIGVPTINAFFGSRMAAQLAEAGHRADVMIANNVVAHVDAINDFVAGFARLLKPDGIAVFEFAYAVEMIEACEFDTIYHEHLFYHTLHGITPLFARHLLHVNDVERLPIHGGSLRLFVSPRPGTSGRLEELLDHERRLGVHLVSYYRGFSERVLTLKHALQALLRHEKERAKRIVCYGAAAKGSTLVNYLDLGSGFFDYVVDANPHKQGKFMPGQRIPIYPPSRLVEDQPDYVLLLVWNFAGEVLQQQAAYRRAGGRFIVPIPTPRVIEPDEVVGETVFALCHAPSERHAPPLQAVGGIERRLAE
jgi:SAM-dependent methyltransferase